MGIPHPYVIKGGETRAEEGVVLGAVVYTELEDEDIADCGKWRGRAS